MPASYTVGVAPGDGVGHEVVPAAVGVLETASDAFGFGLELVDHRLGARRYDETGTLLSESTLATLRAHDALLLGAVGVPDAEGTAVVARDHHRIRQAFDLWCNLRPAYLYDGALSPLAGYDAGDVDVLWFRENSEGEYVDAGGRSRAAARRNSPSRRPPTPGRASNASSAPPARPPPTGAATSPTSPSRTSSPTGRGSGTTWSRR